MRIISYDQTVKSNTVRELKDSNSESSSTQPEKGEQSVFVMPAIEKVFGLMGDDIVDLSIKNESLKKE